MTQDINELLAYEGEPDLELGFDAEANGLLETVTKMWCLVFQDMNTDELYTFHDFPQFNFARVVDPYDGKEYVIPKRTGTLAQGVEFMMKRGKKMNCHNVFGYDHFLIKKFFPNFTMRLSRYYDTLIASKIQWFDRPTPKGVVGNHGLAAWGARQGIHKPDVTDWTVMDAFKLHRCIEDVKIQCETMRMLESERTKLESVVGTSIQPAYDTEAKYRFKATIQELDGAPVDVPHMKSCIKELDELSEELRIKIEPKLPNTLKVKAPRETSHAVAVALGARKAPPIRYQTKEVKGVKKTTPIKKMYKPVIKFSNESKVVKYAAVNGDMGKDTGYIFKKLKDAREWVKENYPSVKGWGYPKLETVELVYNNHTVSHFEIEPDSARAYPLFDEEGMPVLDRLGNPEYYYEGLVCGAHTKIEWHKSTMSQHAVVKDFLLSLGWKPTEYNYKKDPKGGFMRDERGKLIPTTPKLTEDSFDSLPEGVGKDIANYNTYSHRRKFIANPTDHSKGLLNQVRPDGRVSCGINNFGTSTGRSSHSNWVNAAGVGALYGDKIRKIIRVHSDDRRLVGADMKSAQLSIAAYYANNYDYYIAVADGQEVIKDESGKEIYIGQSGHCVNARAFGLVTEEEWKLACETQDHDLLHSIMLRRGKSKGGTFATLFGASGKKVAQTLGIDEKIGEERRVRFLEQIGLDEPIARLERMMKKYKRGAGGYIELPFGYWVWCRQPHKLFNYLDQGTEAACQKIAVIHFTDWLDKEVKAGNIDAKKVLDYHDEFLCESHEDCAEEVGQAMCDAYKFASDACFEWHKENSSWFKDLSFAFNLDGGYKVGLDYLSVH